MRQGYLAKSLPDLLLLLFPFLLFYSAFLNKISEGGKRICVEDPCVFPRRALRVCVEILVELRVPSEVCYWPSLTHF